MLRNENQAAYLPDSKRGCDQTTLLELNAVELSLAGRRMKEDINGRMYHFRKCCRTHVKAVMSAECGIFGG